MSFKSDLENSVDYGEEELNKFFLNLDSETKKKIMKILNKETQISIIKNLMNPELTKIWNDLPKKNKKQLESVSLIDRFIFLKKMLKEKDKKYSPHTPDEPPPEYSSHTPDEPPPEYSSHTPDELPPEYSSHTPDEPPPDIYEENFKENDIARYKDNKNPQNRLNELIKLYYNLNPYFYNSGLTHELEVRFGTKGIKKITRNDYDNVIKKLKSSGFKLVGESSGQYYLRINCEFLDSTSGRIKLSDVRTEIRGLHSIQELCKNNDLKQLYISNPSVIQFIHKKNGFVNSERIYPVDFDDFNFRVSYQTEEKIKKGIEQFVIESYKKSKKEVRFINRVTLNNDDYPFNVDISISKFGNRRPDKFGRENRGSMYRVYTIEESNVFNNQENYEIEIEINNSKIGPLTKFNTPEKIAKALRKVIKFVLSGLQQTNYPISYPEQKQIIDSYMRMIWNDEYELKNYVTSRNFIGPNSVTLQLKNIAAIDENSNEPNIRKDFVVTDKADGQRNLMFISDEGKIYFINTNMDVIFTGAKTLNKECFNSIIDGELISHDKNGKYINLYAAFDLYFVKKTDVRSFSFLLNKENKENDIYKSRYQLLKYISNNLKPVSIINSEEKHAKEINSLIISSGILSPIIFSVKEFYPSAFGKSESIFDGCKKILEKTNENRYEYTTDGLIFTHAYYGVGSNEIGKVGPKTKITWEQSFKWKPPQYNTIDFLVTTIKETNGDDKIQSYFEDGINNNDSVQYKQYKTIELRCGFKESIDGYINPCQDVIDDKIPEFIERYEDKQDNDYVPMRFYPTQPYDLNAGICNIMLRSDGAGGNKMFSEENEVFEDNTIVEFRYDLDKASGWNWIPLRVRYDKTGKLRRGEKEYGNAYKVCNENWKSIHPSGRITEDMISTGLNIPNILTSEDVYYNKPSGKFKTESMKDFHNLYVKKKLILGVSKQGNTLIDFACGKAGDFPKWINANLSFIFGIDISKDNLENRLDGACARYLNFKKSKKKIPSALFVNGNSAFNIKDGSAMLNDKAKQITYAVFGKGTKESDKIGIGVAKQYGKGIDGFNISSCQFAIHYFFENPDTLKGFIKNITECTKHNGYFIGTCYDGKLVFNELKKSKTGESISLIENNKKIWEITKSYTADTFNDDSSCIGYKINVYQESINQTISEYLINFDYFNRVMTAYGFEIINRDEAQEIGLPEGSSLFSELFLNMLDEITKNKFKAKDYEQAPYMTPLEKKISFLNRYFIYKKIRVVNIDNVELELTEYKETEILRENKQITEVEEVVNINKVIKPKVRKLSKKILLIPATEAIDEPILKTKSIKTTKKTKEPFIILNDED